MSTRSGGLGRALVASAGAGVLAVLAVLAVVGGAAGASQHSNSVKAEEGVAKKALLVRADFPSGWARQGSVSVSAGSSGGPDFPGGSQLVSCLGISSSLLSLDTPSATSPTFQTSDGTDSVQEQVSIFPSQKLANQAYSAISSPKVPTCLTAAFAGPSRQSILSAIGHGISVGTISVAGAAAGGLVADASGFTISFPATSQGVSLNASISILTVLRAKTASQLTITSVGLPFSPSLQRHLLTVAYGRT